MKRIGVIHATRNAVEPLENAFKKQNSAVQIINFINENLLRRANAVGGVDKVGLRSFAKLLFEVVDTRVDGIIIACSIYCPYVSLFENFVDVPIIAVDRPMLESAVQLGNKIGVIATTAAAGPITAEQLQTLAPEVTTEIKIVTEAMVALKAGDNDTHHQLIHQAASDLVEQGCEVIVFCQLTMAAAAETITDIKIPILTSPTEAVSYILQVI